MNKLHFTETYGFVTIELCEDNKKNLTVGWISREPNSRAVFQQAIFDSHEISFDNMSAIYVKMVEVELSGVSSDHEREIEKLQSQLASLQSRLAEYEEGYDPAVHPAPETWVLMMDCDGVYFPVQFDPACMWYWNYQGGSNGEIDYWNDDDIDLRKWFPLPGSKGGEE